MSLRDGALKGFAYALGEAALRGHALRKGMVIATGALTSPHSVRPGRIVRYAFGEHGTIDCRAVPAGPSPMP